MFEEKLIKDIIEKVVFISDPQQIFLFGSRARGDARNNSDYDVLVIKPSKEPRYKRGVDLYKSFASFPAEVEFLVYTPSEVEDWREVPEAFITTAIREGKLLYEKKD